MLAYLRFVGSVLLFLLGYMLGSSWWGRMGATSRTKGKVGEREIAAVISGLTGFEVKRRVRQHEGDSDLEGIPGWTAEVKRHKRATRGQIGVWWYQAVEQSLKTGQVPVLFYRQDRDEWRAVWPLACSLQVQAADMWKGYMWTAEGSPEAWAAVMRETLCETTSTATQS
jgi:hypothetical protein